MRTAEQIQKLIEPLFPGLMGVMIDEVGPEKVRASMVVLPKLCTAAGICHGGALMALADTVGAVGTVAGLAPGERTSTIESKTNFLGGAPVNTRLLAEAIALHKGRTTHVWQTTIRTEAGKLVAIVTQTQIVLPARPSET